MTFRTPCIAVVTGASQGIGQAIATALVDAGATVILAGRSVERLEQVAQSLGPAATSLRLDLADLGDITRFCNDVLTAHPKLDVLINCGGIYKRGIWQDMSAADLDELFQTNVRGTCALTKALLPALIKAHGDIVFVNSSIVQSTAENVSGYAATKHALLALTNSLRQEVNKLGVRVLSVFPGRTATPGQKEIHRLEGKEYRPDELVQPIDVAQMVLACLTLSATTEATDIHLRPRSVSH